MQGVGAAPLQQPQDSRHWFILSKGEKSPHFQYQEENYLINQPLHSQAFPSKPESVITKPQQKPKPFCTVCPMFIYLQSHLQTLRLII